MKHCQCHVYHYLHWHWHQIDINIDIANDIDSETETEFDFQEHRSSALPHEITSLFTLTLALLMTLTLRLKLKVNLHNHRTSALHTTWNNVALHIDDTFNDIDKSAQNAFAFSKSASTITALAPPLSTEAKLGLSFSLRPQLFPPWGQCTDWFLTLFLLKFVLQVIFFCH